MSVQNDEISKVLTILGEIITQEDTGDALLLTSTHQLQCVQESLKHLESAITMLESQQLELFSYHIRDSIESICQITHPYETSELLDKLFGTFCLGK